LQLPTTLAADGLQIIHPLSTLPTDIESKK
jgi:hypothetical protein